MPPTQAAQEPLLDTDGPAHEPLSPQQLPMSPISPTFTDETVLSNADTLVDEVTGMRKFERDYFLYGVGGPSLKATPPILYRSDLKIRPFVGPQPGDQSYRVPIKTAEPVAHPALLQEGVWNEIADRIKLACTDDKAVDGDNDGDNKGCWWNSIKLVRFKHVDPTTNQKISSPIAVWLGVKAGTTAEQVSAASPAIISAFPSILGLANWTEEVVVYAYVATISPPDSRAQRR